MGGSRIVASLFLLAIMLGALPGSVAAQTPTAALVCETPSGYLLLQPRSTTGAPKAGLNVVDPATGKSLGEIQIGAVDAAYPTSLPGRAIAIANSRLYLIDAEELTATEIELDGPATDLSPNPVQFRGSAGIRYLLLGSPSFDQAYLVDVQAGTATNLTALLDPATKDAKVFIQFAAVTADDANVVMWDGQHIYVTSTTNPTDARQVNTTPFAFAPSISPDGSELVFSESASPGSGSTLVQESIDGHNRRKLLESGRALVTLWIPSSRTIFVDERAETGAAAGTVFLHDLDTGKDRSLTTYQGSLTLVQMSPDGHHALLGIQSTGSATWSYADFTSGTVKQLTQLGAAQAFPGLYGNTRWSLIFPAVLTGGPLTGPAFRTVDLDSGAIGRVLDIESGWTFTQQPVLSANAERALIVGDSTLNQTVWLLDAAELRSTKLADASSVTAIFAPDGCAVAVTAQSAVDGLPISTVGIFDAGGQELTSDGNGVALVWLWSAASAKG